MSPLPLLLITLAPVSEDPAVAPARQREQAVRTARFEIHVRDEYVKGAVRPETRVAPAQPEADAVFDFNNLLVLDGSKMRVEQTIPVWGTFRGPMQQVCVWDGERASILSQLEGRSRIGNVNEPSPHEIGRESRFPLTATVRGLDPNLTRYPISQLTPTDRTVEIDGHPCREYTTGTDPERTTRLWLDPAAGHVVRRVQHPPLSPHQITSQFDIRYRPDDVAGWLPTGWTLTEVDPEGKVVRTATATVTATQLNEPVPDGTFDLAFPPGTHVHDHQTQRNYLIGPDGVWEDAILRRVDNPAPRPEEVSPWRAAIAGIGLAVGLGVLLVVWLRLRQHERAKGGYH
jgi:hypothetical protein